MIPRMLLAGVVGFAFGFLAYIDGWPEWTPVVMAVMLAAVNRYPPN